MIKPLILGNKIFSNNLIQGPLAGFSCAPFRCLAWKQSQPAFSCTEMISCKGLIRQPKLAYQRYLVKFPDEGPVSFQLFGNDPQELAEATKIVTAGGADLIDLNCGCPVKKVRKQGAGSKLLTDTPKLYKLISAMKHNTHLPVSIKIRVEANSGEKFNAEIVKVINDAGADALIVHGRHWTEGYNVSCHYDQIQFFVEQLKIPVIGNGDVACVDSLKRMLATGCAGVMIARAGIGRPWLVRQLIAEMNHEKFDGPAFSAIGGMFIEQIEQLINLLGSEKFAILQARTLAHHYACGLPRRKEFYNAIKVCTNFSELKKICLRYFV
jgi:tRNA-dihydrouridine synthase B